MDYLQHIAKHQQQHLPLKTDTLKVEWKPPHHNNKKDLYICALLRKGLGKIYGP